MFKLFPLFQRYFYVAALGIFIAVAFHYLPALVNPDHSIQQAQFKTLWSYKTQKQILSSILVADKVIYGTDKGYLEAVSTADGQLLWSLKFPFAIFSLTNDMQGTIYVGTGLHDDTIAFLSAVNPNTGEMIWKRHFTGHLEESPTIDEQNHRIWAGLGPGSLWAVDKRDGNVLWHQDIGHLDGTPLLHKDTLYVPAQKSETVHESFFYALNPSTGDILWKLDQPGQPWATPLLDKTGQIILTTTGIGQIGVTRTTDKGWAQGISLDGKLLWQSALPDMPLTPNIYIPESNLIIHLTKKGILTALNAQDGSAVWETRAAQRFSSPAALMTHFKEKILAVTSDDGILSLINANTGTILFTYKIARSASVAPLVKDGTIYVTTSFGITALSAARPANGEKNE